VKGRDKKIEADREGCWSEDVRKNAIRSNQKKYKGEEATRILSRGGGGEKYCRGETAGGGRREDCKGALPSSNCKGNENSDTRK